MQRLSYIRKALVWLFMIRQVASFSPRFSSLLACRMTERDKMHDSERGAGSGTPLIQPNRHYKVKQINLRKQRTTILKRTARFRTEGTFLVECRKTPRTASKGIFAYTAFIFHLDRTSDKTLRCSTV